MKQVTGMDKAEARPATASAIGALQRRIKAGVPHELREALEAAVLAGTGALYAPDTHSLMLFELKKSGRADLKLAGGATGVVTRLLRETQGRMPTPIVIPTGALVLLDLALLMVQIAHPVSVQDIRDGIDQMTGAIQYLRGLSPSEVIAVTQGLDVPSHAMPQPEMMQ